jgi:3-hydroxybutyryl-CoA dehydrogenase
MATGIQRIGVLGAGQMGSGIAQTAAHFGFEVYLADQSPDFAEKAKLKISSSIKKQIEKGKLTQADHDRTLNGIRVVRGIRDLAQAQLVVEAITENPSVKFDTFKQLDEACSPEAILASNTSSISITEIAAKTRRPHLVAGMHFMNPVPIMKLVEGIRGLQTSDETFKAVRATAEKMGKTIVEAKDQPGFAVNRVLMPMINEAVTALHEGVASAQDIDTAMKLGTNQPMGPLELADFIGLDTCLAIMKVLHEGLGDPRYRPSPLLRQYVAAGWLGRKTKRGFHKYDT